MNAREFEEYLKKNSIEFEKEYLKSSRVGVHCLNCFDSGFSWMKLDDKNLWAYCKCYNGAIKQKSSKFKLPRVDNEMLQFYKPDKFPLGAFLPKITDNAVSLIGQATTIARRFHRSLKESEQGWAL